MRVRDWAWWLAKSESIQWQKTKEFRSYSCSQLPPFLIINQQVLTRDCVCDFIGSLLSLTDPVQVCFRRSVWVPHAGERPEGVPETSASQTVSVFVLCIKYDCLSLCVCEYLFSHAYLHPSSLLCLFLSYSTVDDCPPNQKVSQREGGMADEREYLLHPCSLTLPATFYWYDFKSATLV